MGAWRSGEISVTGPVTELAGDRVRLADGRVLPADAVLYGTGYRAEFPFLAPEVQPPTIELPGASTEASFILPRRGCSSSGWRWPTGRSSPSSKRRRTGWPRSSPDAGPPRLRRSCAPRSRATTRSAGATSIHAGASCGTGSRTSAHSRGRRDGRVACPAPRDVQQRRPCADSGPHEVRVAGATTALLARPRPSVAARRAARLSRLRRCDDDAAPSGRAERSSRGGGGNRRDDTGSVRSSCDREGRLRASTAEFANAVSRCVRA